jgi:serine/threonine protein kinase
LCKKLSDDQSSFHNTNSGGTIGWRAPECIELSEENDSAHDSSTGESAAGRVSKRIDIFSAGCVFHYTLSSGKHPYGDKFTRESNILKVHILDLTLQGNYRLDEMDIIGEEKLEAKDLIKRMISRESKMRPDANVFQYLISRYCVVSSIFLGRTEAPHFSY